MKKKIARDTEISKISYGNMYTRLKVQVIRKFQWKLKILKSRSILF